MSDETTGSGRGNSSLVLGALLVALGVFFLLGQFLDVRLERLMWPFFIIVPGLAFFVGMVLGGRQAGGLAIPGSVITTVGLILLYQNISNHWESWSYAWALIPTAVGVGLMINGYWSDVPRLREAGRNLATIGVVLFAVFGAFFELALNIGGYWAVGQWLWPLLLIAIGLFLLLRRFVSPTRY